VLLAAAAGENFTAADSPPYLEDLIDRTAPSKRLPAGIRALALGPIRHCDASKKPILLRASFFRAFTWVVVSSRCDAASTGKDSTVPASFTQRCQTTPCGEGSSSRMQQIYHHDV
jgi:hypothetical protein